jgi:hypothetical protein
MFYVKLDDVSKFKIYKYHTVRVNQYVQILDFHLFSLKEF